MKLRVKHVKLLVYSFLVISLLLAGCKPVVTSTSTTYTSTNTDMPSSTNTSTSSTPTVTTNSTVTSGCFVHLKSIPKTGETAELVFTVFGLLANGGLENAKAWIEFWLTNTNGSYLEAKQAVLIPLSEVVISGDTTWQGNYKEKGHLELHCTIKLPEEGVWKIEGYFTGQGWDKPISHYVPIAVSKDFAALLNTDELKSGPLSYINNFDYGFLKDKRKIDWLNASMPIIIELDIPKAPLVGEEATLTCTIASLHDVPDFSETIDFYKRLPNGGEEKANSADFLVSGSLTWQGNLKQVEPTVFSVVIKFPKEGEWEIYAEGNSQERINKQYAGYCDTMEIGISSIRSYFGWKPFSAVNTNPTPPQGYIYHHNGD